MCIAVPDFQKHCCEATASCSGLRTSLKDIESLALMWQIMDWQRLRPFWSNSAHQPEYLTASPMA